MGFVDIVGQDRAIRDLRIAYQRGRIPNAYLFTGPQGVGKYTTALVLARLINCEAVRSEPDSCDICPSCRKIFNNNHTDISTVAPEKSTIKIAQIRDLHRMVRFPPQDARTRVVIIDGVEMMNVEAANAFLKILEEPPPRNLFILISGSATQLLPTIISRCQKVAFGPIAKEPLQNLLVKKYGLDAFQAKMAASISEGSVGRALFLQEHLLGDNRRDFLQQLPELHDRPDGASLALNLAEKLSKSTNTISLYLDQVRIWLRDLLLLKEVPHSETMLINQDFLSLLKEHSLIISTEKIYLIIHKIEEIQKIIRLHNASPRLALESLFLALGDRSYYG